MCVYVNFILYHSGLSETAGGDTPRDMLHHRLAVFLHITLTFMSWLSLVLSQFHFASLTEMNDEVVEGVHRPVVYGIGMALLFYHECSNENAKLDAGSC